MEVETWLHMDFTFFRFMINKLRTAIPLFWKLWFYTVTYDTAAVHKSIQMLKPCTNLWKLTQFLHNTYKYLIQWQSFYKKKIVHKCSM